MGQGMSLDHCFRPLRVMDLVDPLLRSLEGLGVVFILRLPMLVQIWSARFKLGYPRIVPRILPLLLIM